jgi:hypothetical protein
VIFIFGNTRILTDQGSLPIRDIVENQLDVEALSFNETTGSFEYKPIIDYSSNEKVPFQGWRYITPEKGKRLRCTKEREICTSKGWIPAQELSDTCNIYSTIGSHYRDCLMAGTLLGDSSLLVEKRGSGTAYRISFQHVNETLLDFKTEVLNLSGKKGNITTGYGSSGCRFVSSALTNSSFPVEDFYNMGSATTTKDALGKRKIIPYEVLKEYITPEALALWIADDGSVSLNNGNKNTPVLQISVHSFPKEQIDEFLKLFKNKYQVEPTLLLDKRLNTKNCDSCFSFKTKDTLYLLNQLRDKQVKGAEYKFYFPTEGYVTKAIETFEYRPIHISRVSYRSPSIKYDISVEGYNNFCANGIIVKSNKGG